MSLVDPELAGRAIERALRRGGDLAEVYVEERHGFALTPDHTLRRVSRVGIEPTTLGLKGRCSTS